MHNLLFSLVLICSLPLSLSAQTFSKMYGGGQDEHAFAVAQSRTGDYLMAGFTYSYGQGKSDIWVMKVNRRGEERWRMYLGEEDADWPEAMIEAEDGSILIAGHATDKETSNTNAWIVKLNKQGDVLWSKTYGGDKSDEAKDIIEAANGDFLVAGYSKSFSRGKSDLWLLRLDSDGNELWSNNYGGKGPEAANALAETIEGNIVLGGYTQSYGNGKADMLVMQVDSTGRSLWRKNFGGAANENVEDLLITMGGDIVVAGWTGSEGNGSLDGTLMMLNEQGELQWQETYGNDRKDVFYALTESRGNGYALTGVTSSDEEADRVLWAVSVDGKGKVKWEKRLSGGSDAYGHDITMTHDGGFLIAGGNKSYSSGGSDMWLIKTDANGNFEGEGKFGQPQIAFVNPNPVKTIEDTTPAAFKPNLYIMAVGISRYDDPAANLTFAHTDAEAVADRFAEMEGKMFNRVEVRKYLNEEATLVNIKTGVSWLEQQATQRDVIMIFISSHGALDHKGNLYILPTDFNSYNLFATALNIRDLTEGINGTPCKKLVFLDACHSGQSGFDLLEFASLKSADLNSVVQELINKEPGLTVMTSSSGREYSYETIKWGHGAFTKAILEGLEGMADVNGDRVVSLNELDLYVSERVKTLTRGRQHPFTPINLFGNIPIFYLD